MKNDAFMIESFIRNPEKKKLEKIALKTVRYYIYYHRKYLFSVESRYDQIRERTVVDSNLRIKM